MNSTNEFLRNTFYKKNTQDQNNSQSNKRFKISKNQSYHKNFPKQQIQGLLQPLKTTKRNSKDFFSQKNSQNLLKCTFQEIQSYHQHIQKRYLSEMDKRNVKSSFQEVSPWNVNSTPKQSSYKKNNFTRQRHKIKQMIYEYRLSKTIEENGTKEHANFIKKSKGKKQNINMVLLQYQVKEIPNKRPITLIKSLDVNKSYENYLNNEVKIEKDLLKIPLNLKNSIKKEINSSRFYTKQIHRQKEKRKNQEQQNLLTQGLASIYYLEKLQVNLSPRRQGLNEQKQDSFEKKKLLQKFSNLKSQRNKIGLKNHRILSSLGQKLNLTPKNNFQQEKMQLTVSGNKTHKLQYQLRQLNCG